MHQFLICLVVATTLFIGTACRSARDQPGSALAALAHNRHIVGTPAEWVTTPLLPAVVTNSMHERRQAAWQAVDRALAPTLLRHPATQQPLSDHATGQPLTIPAWQTWYELDEFSAMFAQLYWHELSSAERLKQESPEAVVDAVMTNFPRRSLEGYWRTARMGERTSRFERLLEQLTDPQLARSINGVSGQGYTLFSPALIRHYLLHYAAVSRCRGSPPQQKSGTPADLATCFGEPFPAGAAAVKATWGNDQEDVAVFDTSARGIARLMTQDAGSWNPDPSQPTARPGPDAVYTASTFVDTREVARFRLLGMHLITKDLPTWQWITLWWSPKPDQDFGADRPASLAAAAGPAEAAAWSHYKMCTVADFDEGDAPLVAAGRAVSTTQLQSSHDPSLRAALVAAAHFGDRQSLCSNPFIEVQTGAGGTNCIGCHQHSGPFAAKPQHRPDRARTRASFMADFLWSFEDATEQFRGAIVKVMNSPEFY